jgi:hypothetical protein
VKLCVVNNYACHLFLAAMKVKFPKGSMFGNAFDLLIAEGTKGSPICMFKV